MREEWEMDRRTDQSETAKKDADLIHIDPALEIHNYESSFNTYYHILTPLHVIVMYNTCNIPNVEDALFSVSPSGSHYQANTLHAQYISKPHRHNYFELLIVLKGQVMQEIEGKEYLYAPGACCLINRNITHTERFLGEGTILFLGLSIDFVRELIAECSTSFFSSPVVTSPNPIFTFMEENIRTDTQKYYLDFFPVYGNLQEKSDPSCSFDSKHAANLHRITDRLTSTLFLPRLGADCMIRGLIFELFDYLANPKAFHILPVKLSSKNDFVLFSRIRHLMQDTDGRMSRSQLESALHYSGNYLNSIVKKYTGMSLFDYGMTFCLEKAATLLVTTDLPVSAIVESLHFSNWGHFNRLFEKAYGMSPREYRKLHRKHQKSSPRSAAEDVPKKPAKSS